MKERPIIFNAEMVRAIINGRKTQTRRVVKPQPIPYGEASPYAMATQREHIGKPWMPVGGVYQDRWPCPYGQPGDRMWVKETHAFSDSGFPDSPNVIYRADDMFSNCWPGDIGWNWSPSIFMPRWASRITLEITGVRVERLQDISDEDAKAEGVSWTRGATVANTPKSAFCRLWESLHGLGSWDANPFVWVIEFRKEAKP